MSSAAVAPGKVRFRLPGMRADMLPFTARPGMIADNRASSRSRRPAMRAASRFHLHCRQTGGFPKPDDQRRRQRAGAQPALLSAAGKQRRQPHARPAAHIQRADALRAVKSYAR